MTTYYYSASYHVGLDGILVLVKGGVFESDEPLSVVEEQIRNLVAEGCRVADRDDITVYLDS